MKKGYVLKGKASEVIEKLEIMARLEEVFPEKEQVELAKEADVIFDMMESMKDQEPPENPKHFTNEWEPSH